MSLTSTYKPALCFETALTAQPWMRYVVDQLDDSGAPGAGIVGVDIDHLHMPDLIASEACVAFVMRDGCIDATSMHFRNGEAERFICIRQLVAADILPARMTHCALGHETSQINTLVFRYFTLAYAFDDDEPEEDYGSSFQARIILHEAARHMEPRKLHHTIQACLDGFTAVHDQMRERVLLAPTPYELERLMPTASESSPS